MPRQLRALQQFAPSALACLAAWKSLLSSPAGSHEDGVSWRVSACATRPAYPNFASLSEAVPPHVCLGFQKIKSAAQSTVLQRSGHCLELGKAKVCGAKNELGPDNLVVVKVKNSHARAHWKRKNQLQKLPLSLTRLARWKDRSLNLVGLFGALSLSGGGPSEVRVGILGRDSLPPLCMHVWWVSEFRSALLSLGWRLLGAIFAGFL